MPVNFNAVPDPDETRLVVARPPAGSVAPELVAQFIRENGIHLLNNWHCNYELSRVPADKWDIISTFLGTTCRNDIDGSIIRTLSAMPLDLLTLVIDFATQHSITEGRILFALSSLRVEEFHNFIQLVEAHDLLQKPKIWRALAAMPEQYRESFIHFCTIKQYDIDGLAGGLIFQQHTPEFWPEIDNFLNEVRVSDYVLHRLAQMPATECLEYMKFISTNKVDDWNAKNILVDIARTLRQLIWDFVCRHNLNVHAFEKFPEDMWPRISSFIERHAQSGTSQFSKYLVDILTQISDEDWVEFNHFIDAHQIHDVEMIANYAQISALQRNYLYDFIHKHQLKSFEISAFSEVPIEHWHSFIALIEQKQLTNVRQFSAIARRKPEEWAVCADLIIKRNISDSCNLEGLERISSQHFHFLCAFVDEYNINDEHVIYGLTQIPSVRQWVNIYTLAQPLFVPPLPAEERGCVMHMLYEITKEEYRIDRIMPTYDDNERLARIAIVQDRIERGLMPQSPGAYYEQIRRILRTPTNQLGDMHQAVANRATGIDVHADGREDGTGHAVQQLMALPYDTSQIDNDYAGLIAYLNVFPGDFIRTSAQFVLGLASSLAEGFAPLSADTVITSYGLNITGKEFLARCWHYIQHGEFTGITDVETLAKDRENARVGLVRNLADAYEDDAVVCNPGKLQRIAVGILQGRLEGAHIDREIPIVEQSKPAEIPADTAVNPSLVRNTIAVSLRDFLLHFEATVGSQVELKSHVDEWLQAERGLSGNTYQQYREDFRKELDEYLRLSELPEQTVTKENSTDAQTPQPEPKAELVANPSPALEQRQPETVVTDVVQAVICTVPKPDPAERLGKAESIHQQEFVVPATESLTSVYTNLLNTLAQNITKGAKPRWTSGNSSTMKIQALHALSAFITDGDDEWIGETNNRIKLLTLIKSLCNTHRNWAPIHFGAPASLGEFLTLVRNEPAKYSASLNQVNTLETVSLPTQQLSRAISSGNFRDLLDAMPVNQSDMGLLR